MLSDFRAADGQWRNWRAYDPKSGRSYRPSLRLESKDLLIVTGCVAFSAGHAGGPEAVDRRFAGCSERALPHATGGLSRPTAPDQRTVSFPFIRTGRLMLK
ncbi:DUF2147 domain-containing protein [Sphingomonas sp. SUN019]|uniref:DUF2147 domain-containing protein n=1 Tax=Sphingomonas sp. SUN019 TaxID=2937788 RepID=UPI0038D44BA6